MKPLKNFVLVTEDKIETTTASGIVIAGKDTESVKPAKIHEIGPLVTEVAIGDIVALDWGQAMPIKYKGQKGALVPETAIKGIF